MAASTDRSHKEILGEGSYARVYRFEDDRQVYALKRNIVDRDCQFSDVIREFDILSWLKDHPNIVSIKEVSLRNSKIKKIMSPLRDKAKRDDTIHFLLEKGDCDLLNWMGVDRQLTLKDLKIICRDILLGLDYIHGCGIIHRDIKSENIIVFGDGKSFKVTDFGLSKPWVNDRLNTPGVSALLFRAPELLADRDYDCSVDIWSFGLIVYWLVFCENLAGTNSRNQQSALIEIMKNIPCVPARKEFKDFKIRFFRISKNPISQRIKQNEIASQIFEGSPKDINNFEDFLSKILVLDPAKRMTASKLLAHPFLAEHFDHIEMIKEKHPPVPAPQLKYRIIDCHQRKKLMTMLQQVIEQRQKYKWFSFRKIFLCHDILDRLVRYWDYLGHTEKDLTAWFNVSLYIAIKYFTSLRDPVLLKELTTDSNPDYESMEIEIIEKVLNQEIFRKNLYESLSEQGVFEEDKLLQALTVLTDGQNLEDHDPDSLAKKLSN